jgi:hypothetical protein
MRTRQKKHCKRRMKEIDTKKNKKKEKAIHEQTLIDKTKRVNIFFYAHDHTGNTEQKKKPKIKSLIIRILFFIIIFIIIICIINIT